MTRRALLNILETFFRRPLVYLLPLILLTAVGVVTALSAEKEYQSTGVLNAASGSLLSEITENEGGFGFERPSVVTARNINQLLGTTVFLSDVIERAGLTEEIEGGLLTSDDVRSSIEAQANGDTLVAISATTAVPKWSQAMATGTLEGFVNYVVQNDVADATVRIDTYQGLLEANQIRLDEANTELQEYLVANPEPETGERPVIQDLEIDRLRSAVTRAEDRLLSAETNAADAQLAADVSETVVSRQLRILDDPALPNAPVGGLKEAVQTVAIFVVLGLALSVALVLLAAVLDRSIRLPADISSKFGLEVLGVVPSAKRA